MLEFLRRRREEDEQGFTLIELMVVVLIIAILIAIAIPTFLGAQDRARDRGAQSELRNALTAAKTVATDNEGLFASDDATETSALADAEPSLTFGSNSGGEKKIGVHVGDSQDADTSGNAGTSKTAIILWQQSASGTWFGIYASREGAVKYCKGTGATGATTASNIATCSGSKW